MNHPPFIIETAQIHQLADRDIAQMVDLFLLVWPPKKRNARAELIEKCKWTRGQFDIRFLIRENDRIVAHTNIFSRPMLLGQKKVVVMALSGVCVHPNFRGRSYGKALVEKAFKYVDNRRFQCSLYQTEVPEFYDKLGARTLDNKVINSLDPKFADSSPFEDAFVMVYPKSYAEIEGTIDLLGDRF